MRPIEKVILFVGLTAAVAAAAILLPAYAKGRVSNCGGNSATMSACRTIMLDMRLASEDLGKRFDVRQLSRERKTDIAIAATNYWIVRGKILLRKNISIGNGSNQIMAVCDAAYDNVPQPTIWNHYKKNPAHAVGYSDGSVGLISPADFKKLNLAEFVDASSLASNEVAKAEAGPTK